MSQALFEILHEDAELLVINKPAGLVCHPTKGDAWSSLISRIRLHLGPDAHPQLVNRLDRETSGVTVAAKTEPAARALRRLWEQRMVCKQYLGIVHGHLSKDYGRIDAPLGKDERSRVAIKDCVREDGAPAITDYVVERRFTRPPDEQSYPGGSPAEFSLVRLSPQTGRKHQLRIHLAYLGHPLVGEKIYGPNEDLYLALVEDRLGSEQKRQLILPHHALHASEVRFDWGGQTLTFQAQPESWFTEFVR